VLDSSLIPSGENADTIQLFRNGARLPDCTGAEGYAYPDPCVWSRTQLGSNGDVKITAYTFNASSWNFGRLSDQSQPLYDAFKGFFQPVDNPPRSTRSRPGVPSR
jgi:hypothetical protein